jgi:hypothetical protein
MHRRLVNEKYPALPKTASQSFHYNVLKSDLENCSRLLMEYVACNGIPDILNSIQHKTSSKDIIAAARQTFSLSYWKVCSEFVHIL